MIHHADFLRAKRFPHLNVAPFRVCVMFALAISGVYAPHSAFADEPTPAEAPAATQTESAPASTPAATPPTQPAAKSDAPAAATPNAPLAGDDLSVEQARLADRYKRLEQVVGRLAEVSASSDPRRAKLLREAIAQSREEDVNVRFESVVKLLQDERLSAAATNQTELQKELDSLLSLLLKADRDNELNSQRDRVKQYLKEVSRLIRDQKSVRARTEGGDPLKGLGADQQRLADRHRANSAAIFQKPKAVKSQTPIDPTARSPIPAISKATRTQARKSPAIRISRTAHPPRRTATPKSPATNNRQANPIPANHPTPENPPKVPPAIQNHPRAKANLPMASRASPRHRKDPPANPVPNRKVMTTKMTRKRNNRRPRKIPPTARPTS